MADSATFVGAKIRVTNAEDDSYEGIVHSIDVARRRLTLTQVVLCSSGQRLHGFQNFFGDELNNLAIIETAESMKAKKEAHGQNGRILNDSTVKPTQNEANKVSKPPQNTQHNDVAGSGAKHAMGTVRKKIDSAPDRQVNGNGFAAASKINTKPRHNINQPTTRDNSSTCTRSNGDVGRMLFGRAMKDAGISVKTSKPRAGQVTKDASDEGSSMLHRPPLDTDKYLMSDVYNTDDDDGDVGVSPHRPPQTVIIKEFNDRFRNAIQYILNQKVVGVSCEGVNLSRYGKICWVLIGCRQFVYLFDILTLGASCFDEGLQDIMENGNILKVFHDCRHASDAFYHQFAVKLVNVFDTQVADIIIHKKEQGGELPQVVGGLVACLYEYLNIKSDHLSFQKFRLNQMKTDEAVWSRRPLPERLLDAAAKRVMYLRELRVAQMERMMAEYIHCVNIYLKIYRDSRDHLRGKNADKSGRRVPQEVKHGLGQFEHQRRFRPYDHEDFADDLDRGPVEKTAPSSDLWQEGQHFSEKYQDKYGRLREHTMDAVSLPSDLKHWSGSESVGSSRGSRGTPSFNGERTKEAASADMTHNQHATEAADNTLPPASWYGNEEGAIHNAVSMDAPHGGRREGEPLRNKHAVLGKDLHHLGPPMDSPDEDDLSDFSALAEDQCYSDEEGNNLFPFKMPEGMISGNHAGAYHYQEDNSQQGKQSRQVDVQGGRPFDVPGGRPFDVLGGRPIEVQPSRPIEVQPSRPVDVQPSRPVDVHGGRFEDSANHYDQSVDEFAKNYRSNADSARPRTSAKKHPEAAPIFYEEDFPPLSSSDNDSFCGSSPATPPRRSRPVSSTHSSRPAGIGHGARAQYHDMRSTPPLRQPSPLTSESAVLGRGRASMYQRLAGKPKARLPADDPVPLSQQHRYLSTRDRVVFPTDDELLATPVVASVDNPYAVSGTRVRIRKV